MPIYFIQAGDDGPVKIGVAKNIERRLVAIQNGCWEKLTLIRTLDGSFGDESWLHRHFAEFHIRGEWFVFQEEMLTIKPPVVDLSGIESSPVVDYEFLSGPPTIAKNIAVIRLFVKHRGYTRSQLAKETGIIHTTLAKIHSPDWNPTVKTLMRIEAIIPDDFETGVLS